MPSGLARSRSALRGGWTTMVRMAVQRSVVGELAVLVAALDPGDAEAVRRRADDAGDVDGDLLPADLGEGVVGARVVVERHRAAIGREVVGAQPVLPDDDGVGRDRADLLDEAREMEGDLRIGRAIVGDRRRDGLRLAEPVDLHHPGHDRAARRLPDQRRREAGGQEQRAEGHERQFFAWTRAEPMRSSQTWAARW